MSMECPKCKSIKTNKVNIYDEKWEVGAHRCECGHQDHWLKFCAKEIKEFNELRKIEMLTSKLLDKDIELAMCALNQNSSHEWLEKYCECDSSVGQCPCSYCHIYETLKLSKSLIEQMDNAMKEYRHVLKHTQEYAADLENKFGIASSGNKCRN